ncbi:hypothetical protein CUZ88_0973 [Enterococcus xinjiangensis]|nr:hypothetical protein [Enterococcus lactis]
MEEEVVTRFLSQPLYFLYFLKLLEIIKKKQCFDVLFL